MQTQDITLTAGEVKAFDIGGSYFELIEGEGAVDVNFVNSEGNRAGDLEMLAALPGYWVSGPFSRFELKNRLTYSQTLRVMYGRGVGGSRRIQGAVTVVDGAANKTAAGVQHLGSVFLAAAGAGVFSMVGLQAGTKRVAIRRISVSSATAGLVYYGNTTSTPTTNYISAGVCGNKNQGGAGSSATRFSATAANGPPSTAELGGGSRATYGFIGVAANAEFELLKPSDSPFILQPGGVLWVEAGAPNRDITATFDFEELAA